MGLETSHGNFYPSLEYLYQIALARKQLLFSYFSSLSIGQRWSTLVNVGAPSTFEIHSFRPQFHGALLKVISVSFQFIPVACPPSRLLRLERGSLQKGWLATRLPLPFIWQWCNSTCSTQSPCGVWQLWHQFHSDTALVHWTQLPLWWRGRKLWLRCASCIALYSQLFSTGYPVPLTYQWSVRHDLVCCFFWEMALKPLVAIQIGWCPGMPLRSWSRKSWTLTMDHLLMLLLYRH